MKTRSSSHRCWSVLVAFLTLAGVSAAIAQDPNTTTTVTIHATDPQAAESWSDPGTFTVRRTGPTNFSLLVFYQLSGSASNGVDYEQLGNTVQIPAGALSASFRVKPIDDSLVEGNENVLAQVVASPMMCITCGYDIGTPSLAEVLIYDNDRTGTNHPPFVQLNYPRDGDVFNVGYDIRLQAYAFDDEDRFLVKVEFFEGANSLGFGTFQAAMCPSPYCPYFSLNWSNIAPGKHTVTAVVTDGNGASSISNPAEITVLDGVNIYATDPLATERPAVSAIPPDTATFTVRRRADDTNAAIVVKYEIGGNASNGVDYQTLSGEVTIPAGAVSADIVIDPIDDNLPEETETVILTLIPPCPQCLFANPPCLVAVPITGDCYALGPHNQATAYIRDNDSVPTNHPPSVDLVAPRDGDVFPARADINLVAFAQDLEDHYTLKVEFFEGTRSLGFGRFFPGRCAVCPNYQLTWSNVPPGQYILTAIATDSAGASSVSAPVHVRVSESNPLPVVDIVARDPFASEGTRFWRDYSDPNTWESWHVNVGGTNTATFVVRRQGSTNAPLTVNYEIGGTASNGVDYAGLSGSVTIPSGRRTAQIVVRPIEDTLVEGIETVLLKLSSSSAYTIGTSSHAAAIIIDNDQPRPPCARLADRCFHLCRPAANGSCYRVEASTDLQDWTTICINVVTDGALHFVDPDAPPFSTRFYRVKPEVALLPDE